MQIDSTRFKGTRYGTKSEKNVEEPFEYLRHHTKGKNLRGLLIEALNLIYKVPKADLDKVVKIINILHISSLIIDDVEDSSVMRRGKPCAHRIFGIPQSINCSNYMYFKAMELTRELVGEEDLKLQNDCIGIFIDEMLNLHRGQGMDLYWRDNFICPSEDDYVDMVINKTGGLFRLAARLMGLCVGKEVPEMIEFCNVLGILYQVKDDYLNLQSESYQSNKGFCEDITEGKFSFPIIHAILVYGKDSGAEYQELLNILKQRTKDQELKKHCLELINRADGGEYSRQTIDKLLRVAEELIVNITKKYDDNNMVDTKYFLSTLSKLAGI
ncbi:hypothetical protein FOA43_004177 [Brettanomyces nanus]|uniref:Uncharacterized protein n=1 Tax=Eeniella nana TaxID=13502 RepID=A0A875S793_EENNA|nr:uncharacterized protein FOA43_004177 [Brettanomyces nanus]QPG76783.1 hypothetical protein FOA43_004177 [Brettanomyces nanus]